MELKRLESFILSKYSIDQVGALEPSHKFDSEDETLIELAPSKDIEETEITEATLEELGGEESKSEETIGGFKDFQELLDFKDYSSLKEEQKDTTPDFEFEIPDDIAFEPVTASPSKVSEEIEITEEKETLIEEDIEETLVVDSIEEQNAEDNGDFIIDDTISPIDDLELVESVNSVETPTLSDEDFYNLLEKIQGSQIRLIDLLSEIKQANDFSLLAKAKEEFSLFEGLVAKILELQKNLVEHGVEISEESTESFRFNKEIYNANIQLIESYFNLLDSKQKLLEKLYKDKESLKKTITRNEKTIETTKNSIKKITSLLKEDESESDYYETLLEKKEILVQDLQDFNQKEMDLIDTSINTILLEIDVIKKQLSSINFSF